LIIFKNTIKEEVTIMFKKFLLVLCLLFISFGFSYQIKADMGPKPTTTVEVVGLLEPYYFDLLYEVDSSSVVTHDEVTFNEQVEYDYYDLDYPDTLNGYQDEDGFASYTLYRTSPHSIAQVEENKFVCGYFSPPRTFKIVLILDNDEIIVSKILQKSLFHSKFVFDLSDFSKTSANSKVIDGITVYEVSDGLTQSIPWEKAIISFITTVTLTIIIELIILFLFMYRKQDSFILVLKINLFSQELLYLAMILSYLSSDFFGYLGALIIGELIVFVFEIYMVGRFLKEKSKSKACTYALIANLISLLSGVLFFSIFLPF
jgi:hypothetical protein